MTRCQNNPLRVLSDEERAVLTTLSRARHEPLAHVARAKALLAVADGQSYTAAARTAGFRSGDAIAQLVARFNARGLAALETTHGGGRAPTYTPAQEARILAEVQRPPDREQDGTATWSLTLLQQALHQAEDGVPQVSRFTIWRVLREHGWHWQRTRSWCQTGKALRWRKDGIVEVTDPDTVPKKS